MKLKAYIYFGLAALIAVYMIASVASGRIDADFDDFNPTVAVAVVPLVFVMVVWHRRMKAAAVCEIERMRTEPGQRVLLSEDFVNRWTIRGALWGVVSVGVGLAAIVLPDPPTGSGQVGSAVLGLLVVTPIVALGLGMRARRHILFQEMLLTDERR